jgi:prolyl-tRNA synthetase
MGNKANIETKAQGSKAQGTAISPTRLQDYPEWYQQIIRAADMAENSAVRGCMVIKPWGYGIWEKIQGYLDKAIKQTGHENAYFPLFIPLSFLQKEAQHVAGFAKECAVVTHHRLEEKEGRLVPTGELEEPLIIRPTSETIIGDCFSRWIKSYRDLPLLINQWANVVRWEMRPRIFLRTTEFLWQEGHTVHATAKEAIAETLAMHEVYRKFMEEVLAIPVIAGEKSPAERFPGAVNTYTIEAMTQDGKALQMATSHYLGQNFARAAEIQFSTQEGGLEYGYTTSWGMTTRTIGGLIMCHADDDGLRLPPRIAPKHVVILPIVTKADQESTVFAYAEEIATQLRTSSFYGELLTVFVDKRDLRGGEKNWEWIKKGVPLRIEVGPRDIVDQGVMLSRRDRSHKEKEKLKKIGLEEEVEKRLHEIQQNYFAEAVKYRNAALFNEISSLEELQQFFGAQQEENRETRGGFILAKWCGDPATESLLDGLKVTIRCIPLQQSDIQGRCILTGRPATLDIILARSY